MFIQYNEKRLKTIKNIYNLTSNMKNV